MKREVFFLEELEGYFDWVHPPHFYHHRPHRFPFGPKILIILASNRLSSGFCDVARSNFVPHLQDDAWTMHLRAGPPSTSEQLRRIDSVDVEQVD